MPTPDELAAARGRLRQVDTPKEQSFGSFDYLVEKRKDDRLKKLTSSWRSNYYQQLFQNALANKAPYPSKGGCDFGYWFNYYWTEAIGARFEDAAVREEVFWGPYCIVFDYERMMQLNSGDFATSYYLKSSSSAQLVREEFEASLVTDPQLGRAVLLSLFHLGFERPPKGLIKPAENLFYSDVWMPGFDLFNPDGTPTGAKFGELLAAHDRSSLASGVRYAYRGDGRAKNTVLQHLGTRAKADIQYTLDSMNMSKPWHPYSQKGMRDTLWMRKSGKDHDYESMTSVSQNFGVACAYPMVKLGEQSEGFEGPPSGWEVEKRRAAMQRFGIGFAKAQRAGKQPELVMTSDTNVYVMNMTGKNAVDTIHYAPDGKESGYNERGIRGVTLRDLLAVVTCRRVHHPPDDPGVAFNSTQMNSTVFLTEWEVLPGVGWADWGPEGYKRFIANLGGFFNGHRNGFDIAHQGAVNRAPTYRVLEWDTKAWQTK